MKCIVDLCVVPIGGGVSVSREVARCQEILAKYPVKTQLHAYGTNIEGDWDQVFAAVKACHQILHEEGTLRITSTIKVGTRIDRLQTMDEKIQSVVTKLKSKPR
jgi:uncharacterized protein (TIGR00106 family)